MIDLVESAVQFQTFLESKNWKFCFIGGLALQWWGEPRLTRDLDITLLTGFGTEEPFVDELLKHYKSRIENGRAFAIEKRVLLLKTSSNVGIDVALGGLPFEESVVARSQKYALIPGKEIRLCSAEDLIIFKAFASRPQDWIDVEGIFIRQGIKNLDRDYIDENLKPLAEAKEEPEIMERLDNTWDSAKRSK